MRPIIIAVAWSVLAYIIGLVRHSSSSPITDGSTDQYKTIFWPGQCMHVCLLVTTVSCAKTAEPVNTRAFGVWTVSAQVTMQQGKGQF